MERVQACNR